MIITEFLGDTYWVSREELSHLTVALDLVTSDYVHASYWNWYQWRQRNPIVRFRFNKPSIPQRFFDTKYRKYILSLDPPMATKSWRWLLSEHKTLRKMVFFT